MAKVIIPDKDRCLGCKSCEIACAMAHTEARTLAEAVRLPNPPQARIHVEPVGEEAVPIQCRHCEDAPCIVVCPTEAIHRYGDDGPVVVDSQRCIGCKFCMIVCPFGVIDLARDGRAIVKCDQCIERTQAGQEPACVAACPTGGLKLVEVDAWVSQRRRDAAGRLAAESAGNEPDTKK